MERKTKKPLSVHVAFVVSEAICLSAFFLELSRAFGGNTLSWAYVFEWPILGGYAIYMWRKLSHDDDGAPLQPLRPNDERALAAYNEYLSHVHRRPDGNERP